MILEIDQENFQKPNRNGQKERSDNSQKEKKMMVKKINNLIQRSM